MSEAQRRREERRPLLSMDEVEATPVYPIIHMIRADVMHFIDTPLTHEAMTAPDLTYTLILPLEEKYNTLQRKGAKPLVFCLLLNRFHFLNDKSLATSSVSRTRANLCEILAIRALRFYGNSMLDLTVALTTSWPVYSGADERVRRALGRREGVEERVGNAIEMAILGMAKRFIKSSSCQKVINGIWTGRCVYQAESNHSILSDTYKRTPVHFYDPHKAPLLDHYRLKVPAIRSVLEYLNFLTLFTLFILAIELNDLDRINWSEGLFMVYALGFTLEKVAAMQEHGIKVYFTGTWNGFDLAFITTFCFYASLRIYGVHNQDPWARETGIDCLALIACLLFPRLAFVTLKNNLMVLSLRAMMMQFVILMLIAAFCFGGFLYALWTLSRTGAGHSAGIIAWWMLDLWFGLDASGFHRATEFHPIFGPVLMVTYACLSNTLLLTVLVSILSHTFSTINEDAVAEAMFRKAVSTIEGVKADSLFSYQPPVNLIALCIMLPASYALSPRWFHKVNVFMIRATSFPILLSIAWYERTRKESGASGFYETLTAAAENVFDTLPRRLKKRMTFFEGLAGSENDIEAIFLLEQEVDSPLDVTDHPDHRPNDHRRAHQAHSEHHHQPPSSAIATPPHRAGGPSSPTSRAPGLSQSFSSPLAQLFQPLVVGEEVLEELVDPGPSKSASAGGATSLSYGPASRRRLSSANRRPGTGPLSRPAAQSSGISTRKASHTSPGAPARSSEGDGMLSESPTLTSPGKSELEQEPMTVSETGEEEVAAGMPLGLSRRIADMEERQIRIEALLMKLVEGQESDDILHSRSA